MPNQNITVIQPTKGWASLKLAELWHFRELFYFLAWRDIKVRYKQTIFGIGWAVLNPLMQMLTWAFVFGKIAKLPSGGVPYIFVTLTGTLVWNYFFEIVNGSSSSIISSSSLITKVYFPRLVMPLSVVLRGMLDFGITFAMAVILMACFRFTFHLAILMLPFFILLATISALGVGVWVSAISVKYRDVAKVLPYFIQVYFFLTPVAYLSSAIPSKYQLLCCLNPVAGAIEGFRWALLGMPILWSGLFISMTGALFIFISGLFYFKYLERTFADVI